MRTTHLACLSLCVLACLVLGVSDTQANPRYKNDAGDPGSSCSACHGDFTGGTSPTGAMFPGDDKHQMHRSSSYMNADCNVCHTGGDGRNPFIGSSDGTGANTGYGCVGCHGRLEDAGNDSISAGLGAGLRQHHTQAGISSCVNCHADANPMAYTPVGEHVLPPYYDTADTDASMPCNPDATANVNENWSVGDFLGLDNDGDLLYDGVDDDCQMAVECLDDDNDGFAVCDGSCELAMGDQCGDCDDSEATANPDGVEGPFGDATCSDAIDNDCDELTDTMDTDCDAIVVFCADDDVDGYVVCDGECEVPSGSECGDCDDSNGAVNPAATEGPADDATCNDGFDNDCDGTTDTADTDCEPVVVVCPDLDEDGYAVCDAGCEVASGAQCGDCDDSNGAVNPAGTEGPFGNASCSDGFDNDCDGTTDTADTDCEQVVVVCPDLDEDGYAVCDAGCEVASGAQCGDCDDTNGAVNPAGTEGPVTDPTCDDGFDNDCDGTTDDADMDCDAVVVFCPDVDADGYAVCDAGCELAVDSQCGDCDDADGTVNPDGVEGPFGDSTCSDVLDNDCDGSVDSADGDCDAVVVFCPDDDADGYAVCDGSCELEMGDQCGDCDDADGTVNPDGVEGPFGDATCSDVLDNDCDGSVDSADGDCDAVVVFCPDDDADGYAVCEMGCELASGSQCGDCDDTEAAVNPAATEGPPSDPSCTDDLDNDCDGMTDLGDADCEQTMVFCVDEDLDGYAICDDTCYLPVDTLCGDCDDSDSFVNPGAAEGPFMDPTCDDELDNDCDGFVDLDETVCTEPTLSDYDIVFFRCSHQAKVGKRVSLRITIENQLDTDPGAELTVYGTRSDGTNIPIVMGLEIFDRTDHGPLGIGGRTARASKAQRGSRSPNPASGRSRPRFTYTATADDIGWVTWMAEILDGTPGAEDEAEDTASCVTRIRKDPSNHGDDDDDDGHDDDRDESEDDDE